MIVEDSDIIVEVIEHSSSKSKDIVLVKLSTNTETIITPQASVGTKLSENVRTT